MTIFDGTRGIRSSADLPRGLHRIPHRGKIDDGGNAVKICINTARGRKAIFFLRRALVQLHCAASSMSVLLVLRPSSLRSMFSMITFRRRATGRHWEAVPLCRVKRIVGVGPCTDRKRLAGAKAVEILLHHEVPLHSKTGKQRQKAQRNGETTGCGASLPAYRPSRRTSQFVSPKVC